MRDPVGAAATDGPDGPGAGTTSDCGVEGVCEAAADFAGGRSGLVGADNSGAATGVRTFFRRVTVPVARRRATGFTGSSGRGQNTGLTERRRGDFGDPDRKGFGNPSGPPAAAAAPGISEVEGIRRGLTRGGPDGISEVSDVRGKGRRDGRIFMGRAEQRPPDHRAAAG